MITITKQVVLENGTEINYWEVVEVVANLKGITATVFGYKDKSYREKDIELYIMKKVVELKNYNYEAPFYFEVHDRLIEDDFFKDHEALNIDPLDPREVGKSPEVIDPEVGEGV